MRKLIASIITAAICIIGANAGSIELANDNELESVSAQGFVMNFQTIDSAINSASLPSSNGGVSTDFVQINARHFNMLDSLMISGNAQQNAFVPVNAVNSAVNVPINIVIVLNSHLGGGINVNNILNAAVK
ncbi:hypothetical protein [Nitrosophilus kaiyonis]|uniref:hypothetical protein n=1 Tax=Nitrosophilus kaiyonis TaxID=2930200 RepID=UPI002490C039|nr:hypothetical protein [Nitrosophilus kaiyonis]